jgi:hypothetical protein
MCDVCVDYDLCEECRSSATEHHSPTHTFTIIQRPTCGQSRFRQHLRQMMKNEEMKRTEEGVEKIEMKNEDKTNEASPQIENERKREINQPHLINENEKQNLEHLEHKKEEVKQSESNDQVKKKNYEVMESKLKVSPNEEDHIRQILKEMGFKEDLIREAISIVGNDDIGAVIEMLM